MRFIERKKRQPPAVIIVSLIDILIVLLVFLLATTSFKQHPAIKLSLPESKQPREGASEHSLVVSVAKEAPHLYLGAEAISLEQLQAQLATRAAANPDLALSIRADTDAPFGKIINVMDAARAAHIKNVSAFTKNPGKP